MVVTHPHHPLRGKAFPFFSRISAGNVPLVRCVQADKTLLTLPVAWTSYRAPDAFERISAGRSLWRADDLARLRCLVDSLLERKKGYCHE
ncbi:MAG: DUF5372 family protein [Bryobacterales bacterium]|nr:DUF5372 family protein [Bryobacterales bacterium]